MLSTLLHKPSDTTCILASYQDSISPYVSGLEILGDSIYSLSSGKVIGVGRNRQGDIAVSVLVTNHTMIRYTHLSSIHVALGDSLSVSNLIGESNKFVRLEYCTPDKEESKWVVRFNGLVMYKHNPQGLLDGSIDLTVSAPDTLTLYDIMNPTLSSELTNNRGDDE